MRSGEQTVEDQRQGDGRTTQTFLRRGSCGSTASTTRLSRARKPDSDGVGRHSLSEASWSAGPTHPTFWSPGYTHGVNYLATARRSAIRYEDRALVDRVTERGDERAFRALYERYTPRLLRFVLRLIADQGRTEAEDVVQETWIRAVERFPEFEWRSSVPTWLHGIAFNVVRERWRATAKRRDLFATPTEEKESVDGAGDPEARVDLERGLARLPQGRRTVLVLYDLYGYTHAEVAGMLEISEGTSKSQLHDARLQLASLLRQGGS